MLCLTRHVGEKIIINNNIVITVNRIRRDEVSVGIDAPVDIPIVRYELLSVDQQEALTK